MTQVNEKYGFEVIAADDTSNRRVNLARETQNGEGLACYLVYENGQMHTIQFEDFVPYPGSTLEESARNDIAARMEAKSTPLLDLEGYRKSRIAESKAALVAYLEAHPMASRAHGGAEALYSVTAEKQALLTSTLLMAQGAAAGDIPYDLAWNAAGKPCEPWTLEELTRLAFEIAAYVKPLVTHQQHLEVRLMECESVEALEAVEIDYSTAGA